MVHEILRCKNCDAEYFDEIHRHHEGGERVDDEGKVLKCSNCGAVHLLKDGSLNLAPKLR